MQTAVTPPVRRADYYDQSEPVQNRVYKSLKVWSMYADLEESIGTFQVGKTLVIVVSRFLFYESIVKTQVTTLINSMPDLLLIATHLMLKLGLTTWLTFANCMLVLLL